MDLPSGIGEWKLKKNDTIREAARGEVVSGHYDTYFQGLVRYCDVNRVMLERFGINAAGAKSRYGLDTDFTRHLGMIRGFCGMYCSVRASIWLRQDNAFWLKATHRDLVLGSIPAEFHFFLGGQHVRRTVRGGAGVAVLGYLQMQVDVGSDALSNPILRTLNSSSALAGWLLDLRARVEYSLTLARLAPARVGVPEPLEDLPAEMQQMALRTARDFRRQIAPSRAEVALCLVLGGMLGHGIGQS
ncbi:MAG: hypothetical protein GY792_32290 [Gammaproteobacteria bacterium]|nr:hypothetical protein [Gammaproteobacteria bacterium]